MPRPAGLKDFRHEANSTSIMLTLFFQFAALLLLIGLSAFFSSSEVAFFSMNAIQVGRIQTRHPAAGQRIRWILESRTRLLSTILIGNTLVNVAIPAILLSACQELLGPWAGIAAVPISLIVMLVLGEIGPKRYAVTYPEKTCILYSKAMLAAIRALSPLRYLLQQLTRSLEHRFHAHGHILSDEELESVVDLSGEQGVLDRDEQAMLKGIFRMEDLKASDVMTPRVDLLGVDLNDQQTNLLAMAQRANVRKILLYRDTPDKIEGLLDVRHFLLDPEHRLEAAKRSPLYVPETSPLDKVLNTLIQKKRRTAVVVDEYGGTAGVITRGDILEEIVGEMDDEKGSHSLLFEETSPGRWLVDGRVHLEWLGEQLGVEFDEEGVDRIGGWITARLEHLPSPGESIETPTHQFTVRSMRRNRVALVDIRNRDQNSGENT